MPTVIQSETATNNFSLGTCIVYILYMYQYIFMHVSARIDKRSDQEGQVMFSFSVCEKSVDHEI